MGVDKRTYDKGEWWQSLIPVLALLAPYFNLLVSDNYSLLTPEALIIFGLIILFGFVIGLAVLKTGKIFSAFLVALFVIMFVDFQLYWYWANHYFQQVFVNLALVASLSWVILRFRRVAVQSLLVVFAVINITTLAGFAINAATPIEPQKSTATLLAKPEDRSARPILIHIILDEFAGITALENAGPVGQADIDEMIRGYLDNGFSVYPGAISQFFKSTLSIGHALNLSRQFDTTILAEVLKSKYYDLSGNAYFSYLRDQGYQLHVFSNEYINLCQQGKYVNVQCNKYKYKDLSVLRKFSLSTSDRAVIIGNNYLSFINYYIWFKEIGKIIGSRREALLENGDESTIVGFQLLAFQFPFALGAMDQLNKLQAALENAQPGDAYFLHMLMPHYPYMVDPDCRPLPISRWVMNRFSGNPYEGNSNRTRAIRYTHYWQQIQCTNKLMADLMDHLKALGLYDNTILIIHGDHGSRITRVDPLYSEVDKLETMDYRDAFSTFMALRLPGVRGQVQLESITLTELLMGLSASNFTALPDSAELAENPPEVYLGGLINGEYDKVTYPDAEQ